MMDLSLEIQALKERNAKVEREKEWETSFWRKCSIAILTYITILLFFIITKTQHPFINALVPTCGFLLSTLSLSWIKKWWMQR
jgi:hypothetical protein